MSWSYSGDPRDSDKDQVRFLVQDTLASDQLIQDQEIAFLLDLEGGPQKAAWKAAETIAGQFARKCDESVGQVRLSLSQKSKQYFELADKLKRSAAIKQATPFAGALRISQKDTQRDDDDRVQPDFRRETHDFHPHDGHDRKNGRDC